MVEWREKQRKTNSCPLEINPQRARANSEVVGYHLFLHLLWWWGLWKRRKLTRNPGANPSYHSILCPLKTVHQECTGQVSPTPCWKSREKPRACIHFHVPGVLMCAIDLFLNDPRESGWYENEGRLTNTHAHPCSWRVRKGQENRHCVISSSDFFFSRGSGWISSTPFITIAFLYVYDSFCLCKFGMCVDVFYIHHVYFVIHTYL